MISGYHYFRKHPYLVGGFSPTHAKNISQIGSLPQVGLKIKKKCLKAQSSFVGCFRILSVRRCGKGWMFFWNDDILLHFLKFQHWVLRFFSSHHLLNLRKFFIKHWAFPLRSWHSIRTMSEAIKIVRSGVFRLVFVGCQTVKFSVSDCNPSA